MNILVPRKILFIVQFSFQMDYLEFCIEQNFVYNDVRPENFIFGKAGTADANNLFLAGAIN